MSLESNLVSFATKVKDGVEAAGADALKLAAYLSQHQTEIAGLAALAGPTGSAVATVASSLFTVIANAVETAGDAASANGLNVNLDAALIADVKAAIAAVKSL